MSGVYINMEMPTDDNGKMEPTAVWVYPNGYAVVFKDNGKTQQYTEAVPVPPHGDLIDRKALVNNKYATFTIEEEGLWGMYRDKGVWLSAVENAPAIIPATK